MAHFQECSVSGLDLFSKGGIQSDVIGDDYVKIRPSGDYTTGGPARIIAKSDGERFFDLRGSKVCVTLGITPTTNDMEIAASNLILPLLFNQVEVSLNNTSVASASVHHGYTTATRIMANYSQEAKDTWLIACGYAGDTESQHDSCETVATTGGAKSYANEGYKKRAKLIKAGNKITLEGPLFIDAATNQFLLPHVDVQLVFHFNNNKFTLMSEDKDAKKFSIKIYDFVVKMRTVDTTPTIRQQIEQNLSLQPARYDFLRTENYTKLIHSGAQSLIMDNVMWGRMPSKLYLFMVKEAAYSGDYKKNALNFQHFNIKELHVLINNKDVAGSPWLYDFIDDDGGMGGISPYNYFQTASGSMYQNVTNGIAPHTWSEGYFIMPIVLVPEVTECFSQVKEGNLNIRLYFDKALTTNVMLNIVAEFEDYFTIDQHRAVRLPLS